MTTVEQAELAPDSALHRFVGAGDFLDCYSVTLNRPDLPIEDIAQRLFVGFPAWVRAALVVRDIAVAPFGLKTTLNLRYATASQPQAGVGSFINFFRVQSIADNEILLGEDDRHLDFRISIRRSGDSPERLSLATWVRTHNTLGRLYLRLITPGHVLIVTSRLRALARDLAAS
ncbi:hypothetical protein BAL199_11991 [alpha proteobacterium BAL199]|jgi:hypothetical protein|nr:hypothetical protein BAL199_11991 [alpha proteobacterium BAL199]